MVESTRASLRLSRSNLQRLLWAAIVFLGAIHFTQTLLMHASDLRWHPLVQFVNRWFDLNALLPELRARFGAQPNFVLIEADALEVDLRAAIAPATAARVVANLPYYISTPILQRLIEQRALFLDLTLMLQREVVERITAAPGGREYGALSVFAQFYCEAIRLFDVPPGAFRPAPKVWSSVMRLTVRPHPLVEVRSEAVFHELTRALFAQRRKTILNNLRAARAQLGLPDHAQVSELLAGLALDPQRRAETLSIPELARLADALPDRL